MGLAHGRYRGSRWRGNIGAFVGVMVCGTLSERFGRKRAIIAAALAAILVGLLWAEVTPWCWSRWAGSDVPWRRRGLSVIPAHPNELSPGPVRSVLPGLSPTGGVFFFVNIVLQASIVARWWTTGAGDGHNRAGDRACRRRCYSGLAQKPKALTCLRHSYSLSLTVASEPARTQCVRHPNNQENSMPAVETHSPLQAAAPYLIQQGLGGLHAGAARHLVGTRHAPHAATGAARLRRVSRWLSADGLQADELPN